MADKQETLSPSTGYTLMDSACTQNKESGVDEKSDETTSSKPMEAKLSEDPAHHVEQCTFIGWNARRGTLLTGDDVYNHFLNFEIRKWGKNKLAPIMDLVKQNQCEKAAGSLVQNYLAGSRATYDSLRTNAIANCMCLCPQARLGVPNNIAAEAVPTPSQRPVVGPLTSTVLTSNNGFVPLLEKEWETLGLDLSDSENN